jgi:hypothetical protein
MAETLASRDAIANSTLVWCGVSSPAPTEVEIARLAADAAIDTILHYRDTTTLESEYTSLAVEMAIYLYQKRGVDGTVSMTENGVVRAFEKGSFPPSMLARITLPTKTG